MDTEVSAEIAEAGNDTPMARKSVNHLPNYESLIDPTRRIRMLVIGSFYDNSVDKRQKSLHPDSLIVGIDVDTKLLKIADSQGIHVRIGGEQGDFFLSRVAAEFGPFDIILDIGTHTSSHMVNCFRCLFMNALSEGGAYIVERVDCDYRRSYRDSRVSFMDLITALVDAMHSNAIAAVPKFRASNPGSVVEVSVPAITEALGGIEICDSVVIVRRAVQV
ncbi:SAM-dependent methyltransferase [Mycobacterium lepraemurium]|nr:hypothetical protein [Mycobacterium lepraemurium]ATA28878.1 SAM-dependent methyltransferase [Mycobacterium lepraemurium]